MHSHLGIQTPGLLLSLNLTLILIVFITYSIVRDPPTCSTTLVTKRHIILDPHKLWECETCDEGAILHFALLKQCGCYDTNLGVGIMIVC